MTKSNRTGLAVFIVFSLVVFGAWASGSTESSTQAGTQMVKLNFWDMVWGPAPQYQTTSQGLVAAFNKAHPGIEVTYQSIPWSNWYQTYLTAIASGTAPDASTGAGYQAFQFGQMGAILPIDDVIEKWTKSGEINEFYPGSVEAMKYNGHYYALPWEIDIRVLYYNKSLFKAANLTPPKTWPELRADAKALTGNGVYGMVMPGDTLGEHNFFFFMYDNGGGMFTPDGKPDFLNPRNMEAATFIADLVKDGSLDPAGAGFQSADSQKVFTEQKAAMYLANPGKENLFGQTASQIGLVPLPTGPHGTKGTVYWFNNMMLYSQTKHPAEDKTFLEWYSQNSLPLFTDGGVNGFPVRKAFLSNSYFTSNADLNFIMNDYLPNGKTSSYPDPHLFPQLNTVEGQGFLQALVQQLIQGKDPVQAMQQANTQFLSIMNQ